MAFHHYTSTVHLPSILGEGVLRPTESNVGSPTQGAHVGPDVVWLLDEDLPSANHGLAGSVTNKFEVRITVDGSTTPRALSPRSSSRASPPRSASS